MFGNSHSNLYIDDLSLYNIVCYFILMNYFKKFAKIFIFFLNDGELQLLFDIQNL
jgi:hypothetical protein